MLNLSLKRLCQFTPTPTCENICFTLLSSFYSFLPKYIDKPMYVLFEGRKSPWGCHISLEHICVPLLTLWFTWKKENPVGEGECSRSCQKGNISPPHLSELEGNTEGLLQNPQGLRAKISTLAPVLQPRSCKKLVYFFFYFSLW